MTRLRLLRQTLEDYRQMRASCSGMDELALVAVRREREIAAADEALFDRAAREIAADGAQGWARFRSALGWTGHPPPGFDESGPPVAAEWLRRDGAGAGVAFRLTPAPGAVGEALIVSARHRDLGDSDELEEGEIPCLRQRAAILANKRLQPFRRIAYDVYWGLPDSDESHSALRRLFDRFAGFEE